MKRTNTGRNRFKNTVTTKSGKSIKINHSLSDRVRARRAARRAEKAAYLSTLPKDRLRRLAYRLQPKRVAQYWFSREGGIMALKMIGISIVVCFFLTIGLFAYFRKDLPKIKDLSGDSLGGNITYYDRSGKVVLFNDYNSVKRIPVKDSEISPYVKQATIAIEDKDFFKHGAFDVRGIMRAAWHDVTGTGSTGGVQGGSTITQQLVKLNEGWTQNRTVTRKVKELILAVELEREYSKKDILAGYLNIAPYGGQEYGVEAAARDYFHTSAKKLTLAQATMLAAIPQAPSFYSPYAGLKYNPEATADTFSPAALLSRQHYILDQMVKQGYITKDEAEKAKKVDILATIHRQSPKYKDIKAPYFVLAAKQELMQTYGANTVQRGGWKVITTLDLDLQKKAEELVQQNLPNALAHGADQSAMVGEDVKTGQIVSLVGGTDFFNKEYGQNNYAAGILIPPGSSFKPYDYAALIDNNNNVGAGSVLYDIQQPLPGYPCTKKTLPKYGGNCLEDYDFQYPGPMPIRYALGGSRNVPAVKAMLSAVPNDDSSGYTKSINKVIKTAGAMMANKYDESKGLSPYNCYADEKLTKTTQCYGASAIGDGAFLHLDDHVNGLATFGRLGKAIPRTYILKITDAADKTVYEFKQPKGKQVIKEDTAYIVNDMASDWKASYLPGSCTETDCTPLAYGGYKFHRYKGWKLAVKTGTTNDGYDGLMTSWSSRYAMVSWVGHHTRRVDLNTTMESLTEPMTRPWMEYAHDRLKTQPENWKKPRGVKTGPAFVLRKHIHFGDVTPSPTNDLYPSWYVGGDNRGNTSQTIDRVSNKLATSCTPESAKQYAYNANVASWNIDIFNGGSPSVGGSHSGSAKQEKDDVHNCNDSPPTVTLTAPALCNLKCTITATVTQGTHKLTDSQYDQFPGTLTFSLNGQNIHTAKVNNSPSTVSFTYYPTANGNGTLTATVTDSVLYSGSASTGMSYKTPPKKKPIQLSANSQVPSQAQLAWTGGAGGFTAYVNGRPTGCHQSGCVVSAGPGDRIYVRDKLNTQSNTVRISGP